MVKLDLKKQFKELYSPSAERCAIVEVPPLSFLMVDGSGDPNDSTEFKEAMGALYGVAYTLKFMLKKRADAIDYVIMPLEGLWWTDDMGLFSADAKDIWQWTVMIAQPDHITAQMVAAAGEELARKKNPPALPKLRFGVYHEGTSAQIMHLGPYAAERPTIEKLHQFIADNGYVRSGKHHEIYMGDHRRTAPEKMRTVIRQPISGG